MAPLDTSPYREPAPRTSPPPRRGRLLALGAAAGIVILAAYRALAPLPPPPPFTVRLAPCLARPDGPGPTPRIDVAQWRGPRGERAVVESNGRWMRSTHSAAGMFPTSSRSTGCVAPETFAPFFARLQSTPGPLRADDTVRCVEVPFSAQGTDQPERPCERPALAAEILAAVADLTPEPPPPPTASCDESPCEVTLIDGETSHPHGGGRRHAVSLRRDGRFVCDDGETGAVTHGTVSPATPLFEWLTRGLSERPPQPELGESFVLYTRATLRREAGERSLDYAAVERRWRLVAARLPRLCRVPSAVR